MQTIKTGELRVGNYFIGGKIAAVPKEWTQEEWRTRHKELSWKDSIIQLDEDDFQHDGFWASVRNGFLNGIPIDEIWLLTLGFVRQGVDFILGDFCYQKYDSTQAKIWYRTRYLGICQRLEFVHQLQNLYFALTGEELKRIDND